jgi:8-oxo-dGTP pyrophosphatase MutT (NUDIX family)
MSNPVEFFDGGALRLVEVEVPSLPSEVRAEMDRRWDRAVERQPTLFDGPAVASVGVEQRAETLVLRWARISYRYRALRQVPGAPWLPASVFVTVVQPTEDGRLLVARPSGWTAAAGRWTVPGGSAEPPVDSADLSVDGLRAHAARELAEEIGIDVALTDLNLFAVSRGEFGNIGLHFRAPPLPEALLRKHHAELVEAEAARGAEAELEELATVGTEAQALALGYVFDYLPPLVGRYAASAASRR